MLLLFYGLPIHIMRDLFLTLRDFLKRTSALIRYRHAIREMNQYPDATEEELARENTCIICREEMRPWDPANNPGAVDRVRPKKLPCGHTLHLGCLKSWLERQQVCPTCRSPVTGPRAGGNQNRAAPNGAFRIQGDAQRPHAQPGGQRQAAAAAGQNQQAQGNAAVAQQGGGPRVYRFGPFRIGIGANDQQVRQLAQDFGMPPDANDNAAAGRAQNTVNPGPSTTSLPQGQHQGQFDHLQEASSLLGRVENMLQCEANNLQNRQQELQTAQLLLAELHRLRQRPQAQQQNGGPSGTAVSTGWSPNMAMPPNITAPYMPPQMPATIPFPHAPGLPNFAHIPPRISSPSVTRHVVQTNAAAIPSGSPDLPEGVVIPAGWSLMPLQRMDGAHGQATQQAAPFPAPPPSGESSQAEQPTPTPTVPRPDTSNVNTSVIGEAASRQTSASTNSVPAASSLQTPTPVVAPSPTRLPNWGGSAQLFANRGPPSRSPDTSSDTTSPHPPPTTQPPAQSSTGDSQGRSAGAEAAAQEEEEGQQTGEGATSKGKGRAVSVESESEEEEGDDDSD